MAQSIQVAQGFLLSTVAEIVAGWIYINFANHSENAFFYLVSAPIILMTGWFVLRKRKWIALGVLLGPIFVVVLAAVFWTICSDFYSSCNY